MLRNRCAFRCRAKVAVDSDERRKSVGKLFRMSGTENGNSKVPATDGCDCPLHTQFAGGSRPQMPTSSKLNHRLAKLSQIRGVSPRRHLLTSIAILVFYPQVNRKEVQIQGSVDRVGSWYADVHLRIIGVRVTFEAVCCKDLDDIHTAGKAAGPVRSLVGHRSRGGRLLIAVQGNKLVEFGH